MVPYLYPSFLVAINLQFPLQQVTLNTGLCMPQSATFIIIWGVHMGLVLFLLAFYLSQKVCYVFPSCTGIASTDFVSSADKAHTNDVDFRQFQRKPFHVSLSYILQSLQPGEVTPEVFRCPDGHFRRIIWGIGPYIADYPEQVLLACIVRNWCAW